MDRFVKLLIFDTDGKKVWRTFNMRFIRHFDEDTGRMMLNGSHNAIVVERDSIQTLIEAATLDVAAMSERMSYLQAKAESKIYPINATLVMSEKTEARLSDAILCLSETIRRPWWRKLFGR